VTEAENLTESGHDADTMTFGPGGRYLWDHRRHPCVHPLVAPSGRRITVEAPADHPWHHGLWFTIKYIDGDNFWEEMDPYGVQRHVERPRHHQEAAHTYEVTGELRWTRPDRSSVAVVETRRLSWKKLDDVVAAVDVSIELDFTHDGVVDRTPFTTWGGYGGLALRGRPDWTDTRLRLDDATSRAVVHGTRSGWLAIDGTCEDTALGVVLFDHPDNPNAPTPWYASTRAATYGDDGWSNFVNAAFLWSGPRTVRSREPLCFRYRLLTVDAPLARSEIEDLRATWLATG